MQDMTYAMASRGFQVKSREYAAIIYSHALKGIYEKAESLVKVICNNSSQMNYKWFCFEISFFKENFNTILVLKKFSNV